MTPMPAVVVLIVCKVILGDPDENSKYTGYRASEWDTTDSVMHCRRHEIQLYDIAEAQGADPQPFNQWRCNQAGAMEGAAFDRSHTDKPWRYRKHACPVPIVNDKGTIVAWKIPECGSEHGTVICEGDTPI